MSAKRKVAVRLTPQDWEDLIQFVQGDLANMPEEDSIRQQMSWICENVQKALVLAAFKEAKRQGILF